MVTLRLSVAVLLFAGASACPIHKKCTDDGYKYFGGTNSCYKVVEDRLRFEDAEAACVAEGGHLASIHSKAENEYLTGISRTSAKGSWSDMVWIGLKQVGDEFTWTDNTTPPKDSYDNWASNQPDHADEKCGHLFVSFDDTINVQRLEEGQWNDNFCSQKMRAYICKKPFEEKPPVTCGEDWKIHNNACYKFIENKMNFSVADESCKSEGALLTSIHDKAENDFVTEIAKSEEKGSWLDMVYIGLVKNENFELEWLDGSESPATSFKHFASRQPDHDSDKCVQLLVSFDSSINFPGVKESMWNDVNCVSILRGAVCKKALN